MDKCPLFIQTPYYSTKLLCRSSEIFDTGDFIPYMISDDLIGESPCSVRIVIYYPGAILFEGRG